MSKRSSSQLENLALDMSVGDLVRLKNDDKMQAGVGFITEIKRGSDDLMDLLDAFRNSKGAEDWIDEFIGKTQVRVFWMKVKVPYSPIWMEAEEVSIVVGAGSATTKA